MSQDEKGNKSEVARIRAQIAAEYSAAWQAQHGPAIVAQHQIITAHMENMSRLHEQLKEIVGPEEAAKALKDAMEDTDELRSKKGKEVNKDGKE